LSGMGASPPAVSLAPASLGFSNQLVNTTSAAMGVTLSNTGGTTLTLSAITTSGDFGQTNNCGESLGAGAGCTISVTFTPAAAGTQTEQLVVSSNAAGSPHTVALSGMGASPPAVSLAPASLGFSNQLVNTTSAAMGVTLNNTGGTTLTLSAITTSGDFGQTNNCGGSLGAGASCSISVTFTPTATGTRNGELSVSSSAAGSPHTVPLSGMGASPAAVSLAPASLGFSNQLVNTTSAAMGVTLSNTGGTTLTLSAITTSGDFGQTNNCGGSLAAGTGCTISVTFTPAAAGTRTGQLVVSSNASGSPHTVGLTGTGVTPQAVDLAPASLDFGDQQVSTSSAAMGLTLTNSGGTTLTLNSITSSGDFTQATSCGATLAAGASCSISVTFTPTAAGTRTGQLTVSSNAAGSPHTAPLMGTGTAPVLSFTPTSLNFGNQIVGSTGAAQAVTLTNTGTALLTLSTISVTGDFTHTHTCGSSLDAGASCIISVTFTPSVTGTRTGQLSVTSSAAGSPHTVPLMGTGTAPAVSLTSTSLNFGDQILGETSAAREVTLTNTGTAPLTVNSVTPIGDFALTHACGSSLAAGSSCAVRVTFTPSASGARSGEVTISDNAAGSPHVIHLTGMGSDFGLDATPGSVSINRGQSASYQITISPVAGAFNGSISLSCSGLPSFAQCSYSSNPVVPGSSSMALTLTVSTTQSAALVPPRLRLSPSYALALPLAGLVFIGRSRSRRRESWRATGMLVLILALMLLSDACGGGGGSPGPASRPPATSFTVVVQGTHGNLQHTKNVVLTVN
ncbi:MAG: beta strand repeat-containing protein, partial [Terriglobales bacterium]